MADGIMDEHTFIYSFMLPQPMGAFLIHIEMLTFGFSLWHLILTEQVQIRPRRSVSRTNDFMPERLDLSAEWNSQTFTNQIPLETKH